MIAKETIAVNLSSLALATNYTTFNVISGAVYTILSWIIIHIL